MILDTLQRIELYSSLNPLFPTAFAFLKKGIFQLGRHKIENTALTAIYSEVEGGGHDKTRLEAHRRFIDIQYVIEGEDDIGWLPLEKCTHVSEDYNEEKDILFFSNPSQLWVSLLPGSFAIFFPGDGHAALGGKGLIRKLVIKVPVYTEVG